MSDDRRPSDVAQPRASGWHGRRAASYCDELRNHRDEFRDTRQRVAIALAFVSVIGIALVAVGRAAMAGWFGLAPGAILLVVLAGNELLLRRMERRIAADCPGAPERGDLSDPRGPTA